MNKSKIIFLFIFIVVLFFDVLSQNINTTSNQSPKIKVISTPMGVESSRPRPSDSSERIKYEIEIIKDSAYYSLKADKMEKGVYIPFFSDELAKGKVYKGQEIYFEMVPDITNPSNMILFTYLLHMTRATYLQTDANKHIKYNKFESVDQQKYGLTPLLLCYVDDENNQTENLLKKFLKSDLITVTSIEEIQEKILKHIEKCLFVYYKLIDE